MDAKSQKKLQMSCGSTTVDPSVPRFIALSGFRGLGFWFRELLHSVRGFHITMDAKAVDPQGLRELLDDPHCSGIKGIRRTCACMGRSSA